MFIAEYCMNIGLRGNQEDCIYVNGKIFQVDYMDCPQEEKIEKNSALFAVCDGMGGLMNGELASRFVCEKLKEIEIPFSKEGIYKALKDIQKEFEKSALYDSGTTIAGVYIKENDALIFNAGDSRVYKYTPEKLIYISHDHSYVQSLVDEGIISYKESFYHPYRNIVSFGIGDVFSEEWKEGQKPYIISDFLKKDEAYLICSDGLNDYLTDEEIFYWLYPNPLKNFKNLLKELEKVKSDNYSIILVSLL